MTVTDNPFRVYKPKCFRTKQYEDLPSVLPRISQHLLLTLFQVPLCISLDRSPSCRARDMISAMTSSATLRELLNGELKTAIPLSAAYWRSTWFVPIQKHPTTIKFRASFNTRADSFVFDRIPITCTSLFRISLSANFSRYFGILCAYRIFSMSWSSGSDDFRASTWYPCSVRMSRPVWLTFSRSRTLMSSVANGFRCFALAKGMIERAVKAEAP